MAEYIKLYDAISAIGEGARIFASSSLNVGAAMLSAFGEIPTVDAVEVVRCRDCKHRPIKNDIWGVIQPKDESGESDYTCPFLCSDPYYSAIPKDEFYCTSGERKAENG